MRRGVYHELRRRRPTGGRAALRIPDAARVGGLIDATASAFMVGIGVASGDIAVSAVRQIRDRIVAPTVDRVAGGVDVLVVGPVGRALTAARPRPGSGSAKDVEPAPEAREPS